MESRFLIPSSREEAIARIVQSSEPVSRWFFEIRRFVPRGPFEFVCAAQPDRLLIRRRSKMNRIHALYAITTLRFEALPGGTVVSLRTRSVLSGWAAILFALPMLVVSACIPGMPLLLHAIFALVPAGMATLLYFIARVVARDDYRMTEAWCRTVLEEVS